MEFVNYRQPGGVCEWCKKPAQPDNPVDEYQEWKFLTYLHQACAQQVQQQTNFKAMQPTGKSPEEARSTQERLFQDETRRKQQMQALSDRDLTPEVVRVAAVDVIAAWTPSTSRDPKNRNMFQKVVDTYDSWRQSVDPTRVSPRPWRRTRNRPPLASGDMERDSNEQDTVSAPVGH